MKPIFVEEKRFFERRTGVTLPDNCWRDGSKIYLNCDSEKPLITFKVENKKVIITKNIISAINEDSVNVKYTKVNKVISEELAEKYFQRKCGCCGKKMNPDEVAINLKTYGRNMNIEKMQCKKCFCEANDITGKQYQEKVHNYRNDGCNLF